MVLITKNFLADRDRERLLLSVRVGFSLEANVDLSWLDARVQETLRIGTEIGFVPSPKSTRRTDMVAGFREATKANTHSRSLRADGREFDPLAPSKDE
jgi:hypothetical protein